MYNHLFFLLFLRSLFCCKRSHLLEPNQAPEHSYRGLFQSRVPNSSNITSKVSRFYVIMAILGGCSCCASRGSFFRKRVFELGTTCNQKKNNEFHFGSSLIKPFVSCFYILTMMFIYAYKKNYISQA